MSSIIARSKFGKCSVCGTPNTECVKLAKDLVCLNCRTTQKNKIQIQKANERNSIRKLPHLKSEDKEAIDSRNSLIADLDYTVSRYVRIRDADAKGIVKCYTCSTKKHFSLMQCGHFAGRANMGLRFDSVRNLRTQCKNCNEYLKGNLKVYAEELNNEQPGLAEMLTEQAREVEKIGVDEMKQMLADYRAKLKMVEYKLIK